MTEEHPLSDMVCVLKAGAQRMRNAHVDSLEKEGASLAVVNVEAVRRVQHLKGKCV